MFHREWFRLSLLSLSILFSPLKIQSAEAIVIWIAGNAIPVVCGLGAAALGLKWNCGTNGLRIEENKKELAEVEAQIKERESRKINTVEQKGCGTAEAKPNKKGSAIPDNALGEWKKQKVGMTDEQLEKGIKQEEEIIESAKHDRKYYKPGSKARIELEEHIEFYEKTLKDSQTEKLAREKQRVDEEERKKNDKKPDPKKEGPRFDVNEKDKAPHETGAELEFVGKDKPGQHQHQWRDEGGHFIEDTDSARELIKKAVKEGEYRGIKHGKHQYDWINPETGEQVWVEVKGNKVQNHGLNLKPWELNKKTGFIDAPPGYVRPKHGVLRCVGNSAEFLAKIKSETMSPAPQYRGAKGCHYPKYEPDVRFLYYLQNKKTVKTKESYKELLAIAESYHKSE